MKSAVIIPPELIAVEPDIGDALDVVLEEAEDPDIRIMAAVERMNPVEFAARRRAEVGSWQVTDLGSAEWAMRKLASCQYLIEGLDAQLEEYLAPIKEWHANAVRPLQASAWYFDEQLRQYALDRRAVDEKQKSLTLPSGQVRTTASRQRVEIADMDALLESVDANLPADLVDTDLVKREVRKSELMKLCAIRRYQVATNTAGDIWAGFDLDLEVGVTYPMDDDGVAFHVESIVDDRLVLTYGDEQTIIEGVAVTQGRPTATVTAERP